MQDDIINNMLKSFKDKAELQDFAVQQHKTILDLTKKIETLKNKNTHLESLLQQQVPVLVGEYKPPVIVGPSDENHEETICRMELKKLHDISIEKPLTYEETKKVEIYTKLLISLNQKTKTIDISSKKPTAELLRLVNDNNND